MKERKYRFAIELTKVQFFILVAAINEYSHDLRKDHREEIARRPKTSWYRKKLWDLIIECAGLKRIFNKTNAEIVLRDTKCPSTKPNTQKTGRT